MLLMTTKVEGINTRGRWWAAVVAACLCFANLQSCLALNPHTAFGGAIAAGRGYQRSAGPGGDKVIVHLFEWAWKDVGLECKNFLGPKGFKAVQVSPPQEDVTGDQWWTRYQPVSYKLSSRSGDEGEFKAMVDMCREAGVDVVVDVVLNHMANSGPGTGRAGSTINSKCDYPGTYQCQDFHHFCRNGCGQCGSCRNCEMDFSICDADNLRHCNLGGLTDLDTSASFVRSSITTYLNKLASLGVAGVRVDASKHIDTVDMAAILANVNSSLYLNHEVVLNGGEQTPGGGCIQASEFYSFGKVWEFKSPSLFNKAFNKDQNLQLLRNMYSQSSWPGDNSIWAQSQNALSFVVNHDRLVNAADRFGGAVTIFDYGYALANVVLLAHPYGQPVVLSSLNFKPTASNYEGSPVNITPECSGTGKCGLIGVYDRSDSNPTMPVNCAYGNKDSSAPYQCEHRWPAIANMVGWRSVAGLTGATYNGQGIQYFQGNKQMAITRGNGNFGMAFAFVNIGDRFDEEVDTKGMPAGQYCNVLSSDSACWPCAKACSSTVTVLSNGRVRLSVKSYEGVAFHVHAVVPAADSPPPPPTDQSPPPPPPCIVINSA